MYWLGGSGWGRIYERMTWKERWESAFIFLTIVGTSFLIASLLVTLWEILK